MKLKTLLKGIRCFLFGDSGTSGNDSGDTASRPGHIVDTGMGGDAVSSIPLYIPVEEERFVETISGAGAEEPENLTLRVEVPSCNEPVDTVAKETVQDVTVFKCMADIIEELDLVKKKLVDEETAQMVGFCQERIIEGLVNAGAVLIENEEKFSSQRHMPSPYGIYPDGVEIRQTLRPGVIVQDRVVLKAIVLL